MAGEEQQIIVSDPLDRMRRHPAISIQRPMCALRNCTVRLRRLRLWVFGKAQLFATIAQPQ
jgi:hypothetical protein